MTSFIALSRIIVSFLLEKYLFLKAVSSSQKNWTEDREFLYMCCFYTCTASPAITSAPQWYIGYNWWTCFGTSVSLKFKFTWGSILSVVHSMDFYKLIIACFHHDSVTQSSFTTLKFLYALRIQPCLPTNSRKPLTFLLSIVLPFPKCRRVEIIRYVGFSNWLLWLGNMPLCFLHIFSWLKSSFLFSVK